MRRTEDIANMKQKEKESYESQTLFRLLFENMSSGVVIYETHNDGKDFIIRNCNKAVEKLENIKKENIIGKNVLKVFPGIIKFGLFEVLKRVWKTGKPQTHPVTLYQDKRISGWKENYVYKITDNEIVVIYNDISDRKKAEEALKENEYFTEESQKAAYIGSYKTDFTLGKWKSSEVLDLIFGIDKDYNRSIKGWLDIVHPDDKVMMNLYLRKEVIAKHKPFEKEYRIIRKSDGETRWVNGLGKMSFDKYGNPLIMIGTIQDITERKKIEEENYNSKKLLQRIINLLPIRIFWKDNDLKYLGCNEIFAKDAGRNSPDELIGKDDFHMNWKKQANLYREDDQKVMKSGKPKLNFEEPQTAPKGDLIWLKTSKLPLTDSEGKIMGILGTYEDITERKKAEATIKESEEKYLSILNCSTDQIFLLDSNFRYVSVSNSLAVSLGKKPGEIINKTIKEIYGDNKQTARFSDNIRNVIKSKENINLEESLILGDKTYHINTQLSPVKDGSGAVTRVLGIVRDITANKIMTEELKKSQEILQLKIIELEKFNRLAVGRELRMIDLKNKIRELEEKLGMK